MKKLGGLPLSAFVAHSRKRKNPDVATSFKTMKKKRVRIADLLSSNRTPDSAGAEQSVVAQKSIRTKKKKAFKRPKRPLSNGNSSATMPRLPIAAKKLSKAKKRKRDKKANKSKVIPRPDILPEPNNADLQISETQTTPEYPAKTRLPPKKKKDKSIVQNGDSSMTDRSGDHEKHSKPLHDETVPKSLSNDPIDDGKSLFQWLIHPVTIEDFFQDNWERAPLKIERNKSRYYKLLMSSPMLDNILRSFHILYTKNIDITSYTDGKRETHNPPGRALPSVVWDYYSNGCSVRMLNPQTFIPKLHALNATLQEFFGCFVGANSYLTPPDSQGFAPHYDDIEAFILQIEGKKRWRLYKPFTEGAYLPRYSSKNFEPSEIGEPILDTVLNAGDLLYFPRGTIHQGETFDGSHSLHVTLSVYQKNAWCDFLEKLIPEALRNAINKDFRFREGLPLDYLRNIGNVHSSKKVQFRGEFIEKTKHLLRELIDHIDVDKAADQMAKGNIHDFLPPVLTPQEQECSILKDGEKMAENGTIEDRIEIEPDTRIRLLREHCVRLVEEEDSMRIYYSTENSKEYHEYEAQFLEVGKELAPAIREIIRRYPEFVTVDDLPIDGEDNKVQVARDLWEKCIVVTDVPLPIVD